MPELLTPMLATAAAGDAAVGAEWTYEPKYDGVRVLAIAERMAPKAGTRRREVRVALLTRNGNDKTTQFPTIAHAVRELATRHQGTLILDGEIVALRDDGTPARFDHLQHRIHLKAPVTRKDRKPDAALMVFDVLADGSRTPSIGRALPLGGLEWTARRKRLEALLADEAPDGILRLTPTTGDREALIAQARAEGWEGIIAKRRDAPYMPGVRTPVWRKLKLEREQEFVVGGWTDPRGGRPHLGSLLLGVYAKDGQLEYVGAVGTGFSHDLLRALRQSLDRLARERSPFRVAPKLAGAHWASPRLVVQVRFTEWTKDGRLRHPAFLGLRDDKDPQDVVREPDAIVQRGERPRPDDEPPKPRDVRTHGRVIAKRRSVSHLELSTHDLAPPEPVTIPLDCARLCAEITRIEGEVADGSGTLTLPDGTALAVTSLGRAMIARQARVTGQARAPAITKGALLRYYVRMAPVLLPAIADRPLVLRRWTGTAGDGDEGTHAFYQQHVKGRVPPGVRAEPVGDDPVPRFVGGDLATLLYLVQLGAISVDPWHSRVGSLDTPDYTILDLDPMPKATFARVVSVALRVRDELERIGLRAIPKTSGSSGIHIVVPLPAGVPEMAARLLAELVATRVAQRAPKEATVARAVKARPDDVVYVDYLQNITGKSVASVYSARATPGAGVSTPLAWADVNERLDPRELTIATVPALVASEGDRWATAMRAGNSIEALRAVVRTARSA